MTRGASGGSPRRRWRCPCRVLRGLLGTLYGQAAAVLLAVAGAFGGLGVLFRGPPADEVLLAALALALVAGLLLLRLVTRPLRALADALTALRENGYRSALVPPTPAGPLSREVTGIERACRDMSERVATQARLINQAEGRRRDLLASVTRDLRAPLLALHADLEALLREDGQLTRHARRTQLEAAIAGIERLARLVDEAVGLARLSGADAGVKAETFALDAVARGVVQKTSVRAEQRGVRLDVRGPPDLPLVCADHELVEEALERLVEHAMRQCPTGGRVRVALHPERDGVRTDVRGDRGDLPDGSVVRFDGVERTTRGSEQEVDLPLAIARRAVELHGSTLDAVHTPGLGMSYAFTLPMARTPDEAETATTRPALHPAPPGAR